MQIEKGFADNWLRPTGAQARLMCQVAGHKSFVWNPALNPQFAPNPKLMAATCLWTEKVIGLPTIAAVVVDVGEAVGGDGVGFGTVPATSECRPRLRRRIRQIPATDSDPRETGGPSRNS